MCHQWKFPPILFGIFHSLTFTGNSTLLKKIPWLHFAVIKLKTTYSLFMEFSFVVFHLLLVNSSVWTSAHFSLLSKQKAFNPLVKVVSRHLWHVYCFVLCAFCMCLHSPSQYNSTHMHAFIHVYKHDSVLVVIFTPH